VVIQIILHTLAINSFQMASGNHPGRKGERGSPVEFIQEVILSGQKEREKGFGISLKLGQSMKLRKDFQS
jgi:hypothetical protein